MSSRPHPHHPSSPTPSQGPPTFSKRMSLETIPSQAPGAPAGAWSALPAKGLLQPQAAERPPHPGCSRCCPAPGRLRTPSFSAGRRPQGPRGSHHVPTPAGLVLVRRAGRAAAGPAVGPLHRFRGPGHPRPSFHPLAVFPRRQGASSGRGPASTPAEAWKEPAASAAA